MVPAQVTCLLRMAISIFMILTEQLNYGILMDQAVVVMMLLPGEAPMKVGNVQFQAHII